VSVEKMQLFATLTVLTHGAAVSSENNTLLAMESLIGRFLVPVNSLYCSDSATTKRFGRNLRRKV